MDDIDSFSTNEIEPGAAEPRLTGRMVLLCLVGFFGVVFAVNAVMVDAAISTFGGVETESSYQAGREFERETAMAKAQDERHWQIDAKLTHAADGSERLDIDARDAAGHSLAGLDAIATFERPTDRRQDRQIAVSEAAPGRFHGNAAVAAGQWDLVIELSRGGERQFRSKNRVILK